MSDSLASPGQANSEPRKNCQCLDFIVRHRVIWLVMVCVIGVGLDQWSKRLVQANLAESYPVKKEVIVDGEPVEVMQEVFYPVKTVEVIHDTFDIIYKENPAAAFSLTRSLPDWFRRPMLIIVSSLATIFFLFWYLRMRAPDGLLLGSFSFILAGALGNLYDRVMLGYVIDFFDFYLGFMGYHHLHWATFNVADTLIVVGAFGVVYRTLRPWKGEGSTPESA
jgi:signal peptidase II